MKLKIYLKNKCNFITKKIKLLIIDFGSQVTKLIARRIRELGVYSEIITPEELSKIKIIKILKGLIFSGGPSTVTKKFSKCTERYI